MRSTLKIGSPLTAKARLFEEKGQFVDALGQWEILGIIYSSYPGLNVEVERLVKRRDHQARCAARARWVENVDRNLQARDYSRALDACRKAQAEFPDNLELAELAKQASAGMELRARVRALVSQGQQLNALLDFEEGLEALRNAYRLDERSRVSRAVL